MMLGNAEPDREELAIDGIGGRIGDKGTYLSCSAPTEEDRKPSCGVAPGDGEKCMYLPAIPVHCDSKGCWAVMVVEQRAWGMS